MEPTVIIALITALAAIVAPVFTSVINNHHALKLKEIEEEENRLKSIDLHEREVLENALSGIGILMSYKDADSIKEACKNILTAVAYVDTGTGERLQRLVSVAIDYDETIDIKEYSEVCVALKNEILKRTNKAYTLLEK